jgi:predicted ArsR family transcriptional regulator
MAEATDTKHRLLERLKRVSSASAGELAMEFGRTDTAIRQHLESLEQAGLVERITTVPHGRGRPPLAWRVTPASAEAFPDRHADLTVGLIEAIRAEFGEKGLQAVLNNRAAVQRADYPAVNPNRDLLARVQILADRRSAEGYLAEAHRQSDGSVVLVEHHCPISDAARSCSGLCQAELDLFRQVLGPNVAVERRQHLLAGDARCDYVVRGA